MLYFDAYKLCIVKFKMEKSVKKDCIFSLFFLFLLWFQLVTVQSFDNGISTAQIITVKNSMLTINWKIKLGNRNIVSRLSRA